MSILRFFLAYTLISFAAFCQAADYGFDIQNAEMLSSGKSLELRANISFRFSQRAIEALNNGVPLTLIVQVKVNRNRRFIWNKTVVKKKFVYRLTYRALPGRFRVFTQSNGQYRSFTSMKAAVETLGRIHEIDLMNLDDVQEGKLYTAHLKAYLDIESLPLPLRSVAYLIPQWYISSAWFKWPLEKLSHP